MDGCEGNAIELTTNYGGSSGKKKRKPRLDRVYKQKSVIPSNVMELYRGKKGK